MTSYARKTCSNCGIQLPQPEMLQRDVTPLGVRGNPLPTRQKWFCAQCAPRTSEDLWRDIRQREAAVEKAFREKDNVNKRIWREEQERRRLANLSVPRRG